MRLKLTPARDLPTPGTAAVEVLACDLSRGAGSMAIRVSCGNRILRELLRRRARFVAVTIGAGGRALAECTESGFTELGANLIDFTPFMPGPIVFTPFGLSPQMREMMLTGAQRRDLETARPEGRA